MADATAEIFARQFLEYSREKLVRQNWPRLREAVEALSSEQVWWRADETNNSIGNLLLHLNGNLRQWILSGIAGVRDTRKRQTEFDEREQIAPEKLLSQLEGTIKDCDAVLSGLDVEELLERRRIQNHDVSVLEAVYHVVEHFGTHYGQILYINKLLLKRDLGHYAYLNQQPAHQHKP